jgi:hypothetical protein
MVADLSDFTDQETDNGDETGPSLKLYTAGSGGGEWAYVIEGSGSPTRNREPYSGDTKGGFVPQLKAITEGIAFLDDEYPNAEVIIFTPSEPIVGLVKGETDPDDSYRDLYRKANTNYNEHRSRWSIKHLGGDKDNPAQDLL